MKKMKRLAALFLAVVMIMAMGMTAMAAGDNSIVIKGALDNAKYSAYKIFNVDQTGEGEEAGYTYTRPLDAKELDDLNGLFTVTKGSTAVYYTPKDNLTGSELATELKKVAKDYALNNPVEVTGQDGTATITNLETGYYYVESDQGSVAMLRAVNGTTEITEKSSDTSWGDNGGKKAYSDENRTTEDKFYAIGDTIYYEVTYKNAVNFVKSEDGTTTEKVYQYRVKDTMPAGVELNTDSIVVTVTEKSGDNPVHENVVFTETLKSTGGFEIVIPWAATQTVDEDNPATAEDFTYKNVPAEIKVTYSAKVTKDVNSTGAPLTNKARVSYNTNAFTPDDTPDPGDNDVYTGAVKIQKFDGEKGTVNEFADANIKLNATFKIRRAIDDKYLIQDKDTLVITWGTEEEATPFPTGTAGEIEVKGLDAGTYYLKETVAPDGYNALAVDKEFVIAEGNSTDANKLAVSAAVPNEKGAVLPSTGGIGTTIFYIVGGIMVLGAAVLLITKKRMSAK